LSWAVLALLSAVALAASDGFAKSLSANFDFWRTTAQRHFFAVPLLAAVLLFTSPVSLGGEFWRTLALLLPLEVAAAFLYVYSISISPLSLSLPFLSFTPVFMIFTSRAVLGETLSARGILGICLVVSGAYVLHLGRGARFMDPFKSLVRNRGSLGMLAVAALYSMTSVLGKKAALVSGAVFFGAFYFVVLGFVIPLTAVLLGKLKPADVVNTRPAAIMSGLMLGLMGLLHFLAITRGEAAYVVSVKRMSALFGVLIGAVAFGERFWGYRMFGAALMVAGAALVSTA